MGENVIIQIWCDVCNDADNECGHPDVCSRNSLRKRLIERGWVISRRYDGGAYCPACAKNAGIHREIPILWPRDTEVDE